MSGKNYEGTVAKWLGTFGWIDFEQGRRITSIFFCGAAIVPDDLGRTADATFQGSPVKFQIVKTLHKGQDSEAATNVIPLFREIVKDPDALRRMHREISIVEKIEFNSARLRRESGDSIFLKAQDVVEEFRNRFRELRVGDCVYHAVDAPKGERATWRAIRAEIYSREEQVALCGR
jgi:hypothetical protein